MRDLIACLYAALSLRPRRPVRTIRTARTLYQHARSWFCPPPLQRALPVIPPAPAYARRPRPRPYDSLPHPAEQPRGPRHARPRLIRPYYKAYEQALAGQAQHQREHLTAALTTVGVDYNPCLALAR